MSEVYKLEPYDIEELKNKPKRRIPHGVTPRDAIGLVEKFVGDGYICCKVCTCEDNRKAHIESTILRRSVKLRNYENTVKVVLRGNDVFLVKKSAWEE